MHATITNLFLMLILPFVYSQNAVQREQGQGEWKVRLGLEQSHGLSLGQC